MVDQPPDFSQDTTGSYRVFQPQPDDPKNRPFYLTVGMVCAACAWFWNQQGEVSERINKLEQKITRVESVADNERILRIENKIDALRELIDRKTGRRR